jgi:D-alanyl-D-alanine-carboxypeptidase/D-alanyl-D-alanine-endopeptidase
MTRESLSLIPRVFMWVGLLFGAASLVHHLLPGDLFERPDPRANVLRDPGFRDVSAFSADDVARIDDWLGTQVELADYPGLSVAIVRGGEVVYARAFGFEDVEAESAFTLETSSHVASVTKAITATLAVRLQEDGVVDLDDPVAEHLPPDVAITTDPALGATITLRQLASHTSGLPRHVLGSVQSVEGRYALEPERLYELLARAELQYDPGTDEVYSNLGFGLLGHALARAAGSSFEQLVEELLCEPLGMARTGIHPEADDRVATGYDEGEPRLPDDHGYRMRMAASGGLITTAPDLARFLTAQMEPGLLSAEGLRELHTPTRLADGSPAYTALGWTVRPRVSAGVTLQKNGARNNASAWMGFAPEHGVGAVVITNCGGPQVDPIGIWLLERSVPGGARLVSPHGFAKVAPYTGVRWDGDRPVVCVDGTWSPLVSVDDLPIDRIMEFARSEFGSDARERFAEDLVELLATMGHTPGWEVELGFETASGEVRAERVLMTNANRVAVRG